MNEDIYPIYNNSIGMAFQWKRGASKTNGKIQVIFRDTGLLLSRDELLQFFNNVQCTKNSGGPCNFRCGEMDCRSLLLDTPASQVSLAVSARELNAIEDLIQGTLFQLDLSTYLNGICND